MTTLTCDLSGRTALITGGFSGIGLSFTRTLARSGAKVAMCGRRVDLGKKLADELKAEGHHAVALRMDVQDVKSVNACMAEAKEALGGLDIVVNNAGIGAVKPSLDMTEADWNAVVGVNLTGAWFVAQAAGEQMRASKKGGSIINIASILGLRVASQMLAYTTSKAALLQMTKALALEWARYDIRVNAIAPGYVETDMNRDFFQTEAGKMVINRIPQRRIGNTSDLDGALLLLASDSSSFMTGSVITVDGGHVVNSL